MDWSHGHTDCPHLTLQGCSELGGGLFQFYFSLFYISIALILCMSYVELLGVGCIQFSVEGGHGKRNV